MLKQSAEGGLDAYKECILAKTDRREHAKWKERAEELEQVLADSLESAATAIAVIDAALCPRTPPPPSAPPAAAQPPPPLPIRTMMDSLKPPTLCPDSTPYDLKQWQRKFGTYFCRSGCDLWIMERARGQAQRLLRMHRASSGDQDPAPRGLQRGEVSRALRPPHQRQPHRDLGRHLPLQHPPLHPSTRVLGNEARHGERGDGGGLRRAARGPRRVG